MKIDLRMSRGVLDAEPFSAKVAGDRELSEDELIAETMRRRHQSGESADETILTPEPESKKAVAAAPSKRKPVRELFLLLLLLVVAGYYLHDRGILQPYEKIVTDYWSPIIGLDISSLTEGDNVQEFESVVGDTVLPEDIFNKLMPVTEDIAALADSLAVTGLDTLVVDSQAYAEPQETSYMPVAQQPIQLSDADITIINNGSLLLLSAEILKVLPGDMNNVHFFLKRDALNITASAGGPWVAAVKQVLDRFVVGNYTKNYSAGNIKVSSKFELIMNAEQNFQPQVLDELHLLDVLAHPFNDYLEKIELDMLKGINNNPGTFIFSGSADAMQRILEYWAGSRTNIRLRSIDLNKRGNTYLLTLDVEFFTYTS